MQNERRFSISRNGMILIIYAFVMFLPEYFSGTFIDLLDNLLFVMAIALLVLTKYKPSKFMYLMFAYYVYLIAISFYNGLPNADIHMIVSNMKIVVFVAFVEKQILGRTKETLNLLTLALGIMVLVDFATLVFFPEGLYTSTLEWNDWSTSDVRHWFFGNKNNRVYWYMLLQLLLYLKYKICGEQKNKGKMIAFSALAIIGMVLSDSSTATVVILISTIAFVVGMYKKRPIKFNSYVMMVIYLIVWGMIVSGATEFMNDIISMLFQKDTTFSGRATIWQTVLLSIAQKPVFGWGNLNGDVATELMGNLSFTSAHNQIMNTLWQGGICLFAVLVLLMCNVLKKIHSWSEKNVEFTLALSMFALLVDMLFESILSISATWIFLLLCYIAHSLMMKKQGERG